MFDCIYRIKFNLKAYSNHFKTIWFIHFNILFYW